ncbi:MAG: lipid-A-disaccharide synthase [Desulfobacterales bacterium]|jgi:lipid-A-disaccharide synthase
MESSQSQFCVTILAGEASGDQHGAKLVAAMRQKSLDIFFCGMGGDALRQAGVRIVMEASELTVVGITEVFAKIPSILKGMAKIKNLLKSVRPDLLILIDFPDFNLHIAAHAKRLNIPVLYYISPQIWAWRQGRVKRIGKLVDHMAVILPFEQQFYQDHNVPVTYVGHPLMDANLPASHQALNVDSKGEVVIGLVPGSRENEIIRHLPVMLDSIEILKKRFRRARFIISHAPSIELKWIQSAVGGHRLRSEVEVVSDGVEKIFGRCDVIVAASGTVTLQAAIHGVPMVIIYKVSPISFWLGRALVRVPNIGLVNLVAGERLVPELVQHEASAENIASALEHMLSDANQFIHLKQQLFALRDILGGGGASDRVADIALKMLNL